MGKASARKRVARDPKSGRFEADSPLNDPALLEFAVRTFRALDHLEPIFRAIGQSADAQARQFAAVGFVLAGMREDIRDQLVLDKAALREATKPLLRAAVLYPTLVGAANVEQRLGAAGVLQ